MARFTKTRWMRAAMLIVALGFVLAIPWCIGLLHFVNSIPHEVADTESRTDAIVVLTGGSERVATGLRLLAENKAERVFISGVHPRVDVTRLMKLAGRPDETLHQHIDTGHGALDTEGNASETAAWMRSHGYQSLRLVTGSYHMPRSLMEFRKALPEATVVPHPVFPGHVKPATWWFRPRTAMLIIGEYTKYLLARAEHWAGDTEPHLPADTQGLAEAAGG